LSDLDLNTSGLDFRAEVTFCRQGKVESPFAGRGQEFSGREGIYVDFDYGQIVIERKDVQDTLFTGRLTLSGIEMSLLCTPRM
jgi:hypothetical protein